MLTEPRIGLRRRAWSAAVPDLAALRPETWLLATAMLVGAVLRFATLTSQSLWVDEAQTLHELRLPFGGMLHAVRLHDTNPPLYFILARLWCSCFGLDAAGARSLSALAGVLTVLVAYLCGRELVSRRAGVLAAAFVAVSPFMVWYSQEARAYALFALFGGLALLFCARGARTGSPRDLTLWGLASACAMLTHFFGIFLVAALGLWLLMAQRNRSGLVAVGAVGAVGLAVSALAISDPATGTLGWIDAFARSTRIEQIPVDFAASQLYRTDAVHWALWASMLLGLLTVGLLFFGGSGARERRGSARAAGVAAFAIAVPLILALLGRDYIVSRNFIAAWVPLAVVLAAACTAPRTRVPGAVLAVIVIVGSLWALATVDDSVTLRRPDWRDAAAALGPAHGPRAIVALDGNAAEQPLAIYLPGTQFSYGGAPADESPLSVSEVDVVAGSVIASARRLPPGVRLVEDRIVTQNVVLRFAMHPRWTGSPEALAARAASSLVDDPGPGEPAVLIQH